jgi:hypothetical protein
MIRPVTPGDLWSLRRKPRSAVMLYNEAMLAHPHRPFWFAMQCATEGSSAARATFFAKENGLRAMVQAIGRDRRPELDIALLSAFDGGSGAPTDPDIWFRLLEALCAHAGRRSVQRLYAALSQRHDELREMFRQLGFSCYANQTVMRLEGPDWDQGTSVAAMQPQSRRDVWAIQKLYGLVTPRPVQQAEARASRDWMLPLTPYWQRVRRRAWVLGRDDDLIAYLALTSGPAAHILTMLVHPEAREQTTAVLRYALGQISDTLPVYALLRDYQSELLLPTGDLGFQPIGEQALLCKQTTVIVRRSILAPAMEPLPEPRAPIPTISLLDEDVRPYDRPAGHNQQ